MTDFVIPQRSRELKGWHVLMWMLGFFGIMFAVNGVFLYQALTSFPGEDVEKSYLQGLNYNDTLNARAAQEALGWTAAIGVEDGMLIVAISDDANVPVSGLNLSGTIHRQSTTKNDMILQFSALGNETYAAPIPGLGQGLWGVDVSAHHEGEEGVVFEATRTLILQ
ncbi:MAG: FixH family protein [Hyphomonas sp.]